MASADFCMGLPAPFDAGSTEVALGTHADLPGYDAPTFTLIPVGYTSQRSVQVSGFDDICRLAPLQRLISASCSSGQRFAFSFLQIRSRPRHPCRSANSSPCRASRGLSPPSECALPGAQRKRTLEIRSSSVRKSPLAQKDGRKSARRQVNVTAFTAIDLTIIKHGSDCAETPHRSLRMIASAAWNPDRGA